LFGKIANLVKKHNFEVMSVNFEAVEVIV